jgi:hypothetical protein
VSGTAVALAAGCRQPSAAATGGRASAHKATSAATRRRPGRCGPEPLGSGGRRVVWRRGRTGSKVLRSTGRGTETGAPKGKAKGEAESDEETAVRGRGGGRPATVPDPEPEHAVSRLKGRQKVVRYWAMGSRTGGRAPRETASTRCAGQGSTRQSS